MFLDVSFFISLVVDELKSDLRPLFLEKNDTPIRC